MFRDGEAERKAYKERRRELLRNGCEEPDPWYGHTATDVTFALRPAVPKHSIQAATSCCNLPTIESTSQSGCRPHRSQPQVDYYHGKHDTDVTSHLQIPVPTFVNPHGYGPQPCAEKIKRETGLDRAFDYMHPLGTHRPFPLTDVYFHQGPNPLGPCENQSRSPSCRPRSRSPGSRSPRPRSRSPGGTRRSRSRSPVTGHMQNPVNNGGSSQACAEKISCGNDVDRAYDHMHPLGAHRPFPLTDVYYHREINPIGPCGNQSPSPSRLPPSQSPGRRSPRPRSPSPGERTSRPRSRSPHRDGARPRSRSPRHYAPYEALAYHLPPAHSIPEKYAACRNRCHLTPPCRDCARLLEEDERCRRN